MSSFTASTCSLWQKADGFLFDFDGLILETEWPIYQSYQHLYEKEGVSLPVELYVACLGSDHSHWSPQQHLEELTGKSFDWAVLNPQRQAWIEEQVAKECVKPGVVELLDLALRWQKPCAVVSSSSHRWVDRWLAHLGLTDRFQSVVCREDAPRIKPAPDLFLEGARRLGLRPDQCLVLEDSHNGVIAAKAAGIPVIAVPGALSQHLPFSEADRVTPRLLDWVSCLDCAD